MREALSTVADAIVGIDTPTGTGTGVAIRTAHGFRILTCEHVVRGATEINIVLRAETAAGFRFIQWPALVTASNTKRDLALVEFNFFEGIAFPQEVRDWLEAGALKLAAQEPDLYEQLVIGGNQNGMHGLCVEGRLQAKRGSCGDRREKNWVFSGLSVSGASGGAVTNGECELVGIVSEYPKDDERPVFGLGYFVPLGVIKAFLARVEKERRAKKEEG